MSIKRITTIVPIGHLADLEKCLRTAGVHGMTVDYVQGFGVHANFFRNDLLQENVQVQVFVGADRSEAIAGAIQRFARATHISAGILSIESIDRLIDLNTGEDVSARHL
ncbi:MAG: P-II family nitrogen regulator [Lysobacterales bacterium]